MTTDPTIPPDDDPLAGVDTVTAPGGAVQDDAPLPDLDLDTLVRPDSTDDDEPDVDVEALTDQPRATSAGEALRPPWWRRQQNSAAVLRALAAPDDTVLAWDERGRPIEARLARGVRYGANAGYALWQAAGRPWQAAYPAHDLAALLTGYGYTVYLLGDLRHMMANPPEDHTPFGLTGWPESAMRWWVYAMDIMPPQAGRGLPDLAQLSAQIRGDKMAGIAGATPLKYMNWTLPSGQVVHDSWEPGYSRSSSHDSGHTHLSFCTNYRLSRVTAGYDPVARFRAGGGTIVPVSYHPTPQGSHPAYAGRALQNQHPQQHGTDVQTWQARMRQRGWAISADGWYGPKSADVALRFQRDSTAHGWPLHADGIVGPNTWRAAWERPVS